MRIEHTTLSMPMPSVFLGVYPRSGHAVLEWNMEIRILLVWVLGIELRSLHMVLHWAIHYSVKLYFITSYLCLCVCGHSTSVEIRIGSFLQLCGSEYQSHVIRLSSKLPYLLSHLSYPSEYLIFEDPFHSLTKWLASFTFQPGMAKSCSFLQFILYNLLFP